MRRSYCAITCFSRLFSFGNLDYVMLVYILETYPFVSSGKQLCYFIKVLWVICHAVILTVASSALCQQKRETGRLRGKADQYGAGKREEGLGSSVQLNGAPRLPPRGGHVVHSPANLRADILWNSGSWSHFHMRRKVSRPDFSFDQGLGLRSKSDSVP